MEEKNKNLIFYISAGLIILAGIFFRILFYSYARPFWNDESAIALNLINHRYIELFGKMDYYQAAPPLFCIACKFFLIFIKKAEYALRALPLVFSCLSLPVFFMLAKKVLKSKTAIIFALILFALNYQLIYFSQELKPYSGEVFWFLSILLLYFYIDFEKRTKQNLAAAAVFLAVSVWFSYTAVFALAVLFLTMFANNSKKQTILLFIPSVVSSLLLLPRIRELSSDSFLYNFWAAGFIKKDFSNLFEILTGNGFFYFPDFSSKIFIGILFIAGLFFFAKEIKKPQSRIVLLPFLISIFMSYFDIYPLYLRTCLYLFPVFLIIISKPFDMLNSKFQIINYVIIGFLFAHFSICTLITDYSQIVKKEYYRETTQELLQKFTQISKSSDILVVPMSSKLNYEFYKDKVSVKNRNIIVMKRFFYEYPEIERAYSRLPEGQTYYILLTHSSDKPLEYKNLCAFAKRMKNTEVLKDKYYNALIRFSN